MAVRMAMDINACFEARGDAAMLAAGLAASSSPVERDLGAWWSDPRRLASADARWRLGRYQAKLDVTHGLARVYDPEIRAVVDPTPVADDAFQALVACCVHRAFERAESGDDRSARAHGLIWLNTAWRAAERLRPRERRREVEGLLETLTVELLRRCPVVGARA